MGKPLPRESPNLWDGEIAGITASSPLFGVGVLGRGGQMGSCLAVPELEQLFHF